MSDNYPASAWLKITVVFSVKSATNVTVRIILGPQAATLMAGWYQSITAWQWNQLLSI